MLRPLAFITFLLLEYKLFNQQIFAVEYFARHEDNIRPEISHNTSDTFPVTAKTLLRNREPVSGDGAGRRKRGRGAAGPRAAPGARRRRPGLREGRRPPAAYAAGAQSARPGGARPLPVGHSCRHAQHLSAWAAVPPHLAPIAPTASSSLSAAAGSGSTGGPPTGRRGGTSPPPPPLSRSLLRAGRATRGRAAQGRGK